MDNSNLVQIVVKKKRNHIIGFYAPVHVAKHCERFGKLTRWNDFTNRYTLEADSNESFDNAINILTLY